MRISIATGPWLPVPAVQGGAIPRLWQGLAEEFAACGHQVKILCRAYPGQPPNEVINGVEYVRRGGLPQSPNIALDLAKDFLYALLTFPTLPAADVLIINDFWLPVLAALRPQAGKIVVNANRFPKGQYRLYAKTDFFAAASQAIEDAILKEYPAARDRIRVFPNPIDTHILFPAPQPTLEPSEKNILYVGRLHPEKGIHLLLEAFEDLCQRTSTVKLTILGPHQAHQGGGGEEYFRSLQHQAKGLKVEFLPPIFDPPKLAEAYRQAHLFCYPSLAEKGESFGVAPLEAMACGLAPVVSSLACFRDFIEPGQTGYVFDHRSPDAAANLSQVLYSATINWQETAKLARQAAQAASQYSYAKVAKLYLQEFEQILNE